MPMPAPSPISPARKPSPLLPGVCAIASSGLASTIAAAIANHLPNRRIITLPPWFDRGHQPGPWLFFLPSILFHPANRTGPGREITLFGDELAASFEAALD